MSAAFHRGVTQALRRSLQTMGLRVEESDAQRALAGSAVVSVTSPAQDAITSIAVNVWGQRFDHMQAWEQEHPGESPFPPVFAQVVLEKLRMAALEGTFEETVLELIKMAETELEL